MVAEAWRLEKGGGVEQARAIWERNPPAQFIRGELTFEGFFFFSSG